MVPVFKRDDLEHIAPSLDEPWSSSGKSSSFNWWGGGADDREEILAAKKIFFSASDFLLFDGENFH